MNTTENNKLIAEFMGYTDRGNNEFLIDTTHRSISVDSIKYHVSWDWLMPVVEEINSIGNLHFIILEAKRVQWTIEDDESMPIIYQGKPMIDLTYQAVIDFINYYNKYK